MAPAASLPSLADAGVGIGLRQPHYEAVIEGRPSLAFVEVHSENFFADGGAALQVLREARSRYPVSLHGVGLALGSAAGLDPWHLDRLDRLVRAIDPVRVSDHACFARVRSAEGGTLHAADLLPIGFNEAALRILVANVSAVQDRLGRPILVENLAQYLTFADDTFEEPAFFAELCRRSGCGMLLDLNNLMVNAVNACAGEDGIDRGIDGPLMHGDRQENALRRCIRFIDALPVGSVGELHLAGYSDAGALAIDDHGSRVRPGVWKLYEHALARLEALPTLIEWDTALPSLDVLLGEAQQAARRIEAQASWAEAG
jgi:uncharacterized protein (UPF0276 family)